MIALYVCVRVVTKRVVTGTWAYRVDEFGAHVGRLLRQAFCERRVGHVFAQCDKLGPLKGDMADFTLFIQYISVQCTERLREQLHTLKNF